MRAPFATDGADGGRALVRTGVRESRNVDNHDQHYDYGSMLNFAAEKVTGLGKDWHRGCFRCDKCNATMSSGQETEVRGVGLYQVTKSDFFKTVGRFLFLVIFKNQIFISVLITYFLKVCQICFKIGEAPSCFCYSHLSIPLTKKK